jgi:hypothetical protein
LETEWLEDQHACPPYDYEQAVGSLGMNLICDFGWLSASGSFFLLFLLDRVFNMAID